MTLERRLHLASLPLLQELKLTSGIHLRPGWKQGARERRMDSCWNHSSVPGCCGGEDRSGRQYPCYLPGTPTPEVQGLLEYEVLSCTYTLRSKGQSEGSSRGKMQARAVGATFNFLSSLRLGSHLLPPHP